MNWILGVPEEIFPKATVSLHLGLGSTCLYCLALPGCIAQHIITVNCYITNFLIITYRTSSETYRIFILNHCQVTDTLRYGCETIYGSISYAKKVDGENIIFYDNVSNTPQALALIYHLGTQSTNVKHHSGS